MKLLEGIQQEHDDVRSLFLQIENDEERAADLFDQLAVLVLSHHEAEEQVVFDKLPDDKESKELKLELIAEHDNVRRVMQVVLDTDPEDDHWAARCKVVKEVFAHHIEEEENELFGTLRDELSESEMDKLYKKFEAAEAKAKPDMQKMVKAKMILKPEHVLPLSLKDALTEKKAPATKKAAASKESKPAAKNKTSKS